MSQHHALHVKKQSAHVPSCLSQWRRYHSKQKIITHTTHRTDEYFGSGNSLVSWILHFKCVQVHWSLTDKKTDFNWFVFQQDVLCATILPPLTKLASLYGHDTALLPLSRSHSISVSLLLQTIVLSTVRQAISIQVRAKRRSEFNAHKISLTF